jgi:GntR family transcriptional regulator/MocR family aminotransferase
MPTRDQFAPDLLVRLDRGGPPMRLQLEGQLRDAIRSGRLRPHTALPSTRALAAELGVSRGVVVEAYAQLAAEGWLTASQGARTRVAEAPRAPEPEPHQEPRPPRIRVDFRPGIPDLAAFPRTEWLASTRRALRRMPDSALGFQDPRGARPLREALAAYLGRSRGVLADPERVLVATGVTQALMLVCAALLRRGARRVAVEDPGFFLHRDALAHAGMEPVPVPVDSGGIDLGRLALARADAVLVTPAHQQPTGVVLVPERRTALLDWAEARQSLVIEDDYDAEHRYDREPVGALQGLAPERVAYLGSPSKALAPALRIGWAVSPSWLSGAVGEEKFRADLGSPVPEQLTLADFIERGELDRHLRRTRRSYRRRRDALVGALAQHLPEAEVSGIAAGLQALVYLPDGVDEDRVVTEAVARGVMLAPLSAMRAGSDGRPGVIVGYANVPEPTIERGVRELAAIVHAAGAG